MVLLCIWQLGLRRLANALHAPTSGSNIPCGRVGEEQDLHDVIESHADHGDLSSLFGALGEQLCGSHTATHLVQENRRYAGITAITEALPPGETRYVSALLNLCTCTEHRVMLPGL